MYLFIIDKMEDSGTVYIKYEDEQYVITDNLADADVKIVFERHRWICTEIKPTDNINVPMLLSISAYYLKEKYNDDIFIDNIIDQLNANKYIYIHKML